MFTYDCKSIANGNRQSNKYDKNNNINLPIHFNQILNL